MMISPLLLYPLFFAFMVALLRLSLPSIKQISVKSHNHLQGHKASQQATQAFANLLQAQGYSHAAAQKITQKRWNQCIVMALLVIILLAFSKQWIFASLAVLVPLWMWMHEKRKLRLRNQRIYQRFPYFLDMLILCLESGMDSITSMKQMVKTTPDHPLHREIALALASTEIGMGFSQAMQEVAKRTRSQELVFLSTSIQQSVEMGSSLADILRMQAQTLRQKIFKEAQTQAQKAPVKMLFPLIFFIFPVVFIILFFPIAMKLMQAF
jgi:tight adherence protein C